VAAYNWMVALVLRARCERLRRCQAHWRLRRGTVVPTSVRHTLAYNRKAEVREAPKIRLGVPRRDALPILCVLVTSGKVPLAASARYVGLRSSRPNRPTPRGFLVAIAPGRRRLCPRWCPSDLETRRCCPARSPAREPLTPMRLSDLSSALRDGRVDHLPALWDCPGVRLVSIVALTSCLDACVRPANLRGLSETRELNQLLRGRFARVSLAMDREAVTIVAYRHTDGAPLPVEVRFDRRDCERYAPESRRGHVHRTWEESEMIDALRAWADENGRSPKLTDWFLSDPDRPTSHTARRRFGSWTKALKRAGLRPAARASR